MEAAFNEIGITIELIGSSLNEVGLSNGETMVKGCQEFHMPLESHNYGEDYSKAKSKLKWQLKTKFRDLVRIMVKNGLKLYENQHENLC